MILVNPYAGVDWNTARRIVSISHCHCDDGRGSQGYPVSQDTFNRIVAGGVRHIAISNYHPSRPTVPLSDFFTGVPEDAIECPNAEYYDIGLNQGSVTSRMHWCAPGYSRTVDNGPDPSGIGRTYGYLLHWKAAADDLLQHALYEDAGGITVNHPGWSYMNYKQILPILDYDPRFLGVEIYNHSTERQAQAYGYDFSGWTVDTWDDILLEGRRAWGFCVPDHGADYWYDKATGAWDGRNVLIVPEATSYACLRAYRTGAFFGRLKQTDLNLVNVEVSGDNISIETDDADRIEVVVDKRVEAAVDGNAISFTVPTGSTYCRFHAVNDTTGDQLFTNPFMLRLFEPDREGTSRMSTPRYYFFY